MSDHQLIYHIFLSPYPSIFLSLSSRVSGSITHGGTHKTRRVQATNYLMSNLFRFAILNSLPHSPFHYTVVVLCVVLWYVSWYFSYSGLWSNWDRLRRKSLLGFLVGVIEVWLGCVIWIVCDQWYVNSMTHIFVWSESEWILFLLRMNNFGAIQVCG